eukprot:s272_g5.t1
MADDDSGSISPYDEEVQQQRWARLMELDREEAARKERAARAAAKEAAKEKQAAEKKAARKRKAMWMIRHGEVQISAKTHLLYKAQICCLNSLCPTWYALNCVHAVTYQ